MHCSGLVTSRQGSTSTFYNCCQAIPVVTLGNTEAGKTVPGPPGPALIDVLVCACVFLLGGVLNALHVHTI